MLADGVHKHEVAVARPSLAAAYAVERRGRLVNERHRADQPRLRRSLPAAREGVPHVHHVERPVEVAPPQRQELAQAQPREGRHREEDGVLRVGRIRSQELDLGWLEDVELAEPPLGPALDLGGGVGGDSVHALGALEDRAELLEALVGGPVG
jgi:hypothetical protein